MRQTILVLTVVFVWVLAMNPAFSQWVQTNSTSLGWITCLTARDTMVFAGTQTSGTYVTRDGGATWDSAGLVSPSTLFVRDSTLWAGTNSGGIYRSTDNGKDWTAQNSGLSNKYVYGFTSTGNDLFAATYGGVSRSTNNGASWQDVDSGLVQSGGVQAVDVIGSVVFAGTVGNGVYKSYDNGGGWSLPYAGLPLYISAMAVSGSDLFAAHETGGVFSSTDGGSTWVSPSTNFGANYIYALQASGNQVFAAVADPSGAVWATPDNGAHWNNVSTGLTRTDVTSLDTSGGYLYVGFAIGGVWRRPLSEMVTSVLPGSDGLPVNFALLPNYPNPFNPATQIRYGLPTQEHVTLRVFDMLGRQVATLVDGVQPPGNRSVTFDASWLASGVYIYRLSAGAFTDEKKMVLIK